MENITEKNSVELLSKTSTMDYDGPLTWQIDVAVVRVGYGIANDYGYVTSNLDPDDYEEQGYTKEDWAAKIEEKHERKAELECFIRRGAGFKRGTVSRLPLPEFFTVTCVTKID